MTLFKRTISFLIVLSMIFILSGCNGGDKNEFTTVQSFEYHIYPEEYEEIYNEFNKSFVLESDKEYKIKFNATCEDGIMEIVIRTDENEQKYEVDSSEPCDDIIVVPVNSSSSISFTVIIQEDTKGEFK